MNKTITALLGANKFDMAISYAKTLTGTEQRIALDRILQKLLMEYDTWFGKRRDALEKANKLSEARKRSKVKELRDKKHNGPGLSYSVCFSKIEKLLPDKQRLAVQKKRLEMEIMEGNAYFSIEHAKHYFGRDLNKSEMTRVLQMSLEWEGHVFDDFKSTKKVNQDQQHKKLAKMLELNIKRPSLYEAELVAKLLNRELHESELVQMLENCDTSSHHMFSMDDWKHSMKIDIASKLSEPKKTHELTKLVKELYGTSCQFRYFHLTTAAAYLSEPQRSIQLGRLMENFFQAGDMYHYGNVICKLPESQRIIELTRVVEKCFQVGDFHNLKEIIRSLNSEKVKQMKESLVLIFEWYVELGLLQKADKLMFILDLY